MSDEGDEPVRNYRYSVGISVRHPSIDPVEITAALGLQPEGGWRAGDQWVTRRGVVYPAIRRESYWYYVEDIDGDRHFLKGASGLLEELEKQKDFVLRLTEEGGRVMITISLPGSINIGDQIDADTLMRFVALRVQLGIEVFPHMRLPGEGDAPQD